MRLCKGLLKAAFLLTVAAVAYAGEAPSAQDTTRECRDRAPLTRGFVGDDCWANLVGKVLSFGVSAETSLDGHDFAADFVRKTDRETRVAHTRATFTVDGRNLMVIKIRSQKESVQVSVDYGEMFEGIRHADISLSAGRIQSGSINGRAIAPTLIQDALSSPRFLDGEPHPEVILKPGIERGLKQLWEEIYVAGTSTCQARIPGFLGTSGPPLSFLADPPGHDSTPVLSAECILCGAGCAAAAAGCIVVAINGCSATGPFYALCLAAGLVGCAVGEYECFWECHETGAPCCPVGCGEVACCAKGESCLTSAIGLCCSPGFKPCAAKNCCPENEACIETGPNAGTCCPHSGVCGPSCCGALGNCVDPVKGICCSFGEEYCGDKCCEPGEACIDGNCCPSARTCPNVCCEPNAACVDGECRSCNPGDYPCPGGGCCHIGYECTNTPNQCCTPGRKWCFGECRLPAACIK